MPRDLPGLYWDEEKKRYFPISSRPAGSQSSNVAKVNTELERPNRRQRSPTRTSTGSPPPKRKQYIVSDEARFLNAWQSINALKESPLSVQRRRCIHDLQMGSLAEVRIPAIGQQLPISFDGMVDALCLKMGHNDTKLLIGDSSGWLYSLDPNEPGFATREFGLRTQITSITRSGSVCMVTSLGSPSRLLVTRDDSIGLWILREIPPQTCSDVWCGQVTDRKAIVGGRRAALCFPDIERDQYIRLNRPSDVLSLCLHDENITYIGMRNGIIDRWDSREPGGKTDTVVNMSDAASTHGLRTSKGAASVDYMRIVNDYGLLIRTVRGDLEVHDLRYLRNITPLLQFNGHVASYESRLGLTVDPNDNFLFAGGGDSRLRIWSLRTGELLPEHSGHLSVALEGRIARPTQPIRAMEIVQEESEVSLWMATDMSLCRTTLGPHGLLS